MKLEEAIRVTERKLHILKQLLPISERVQVCVNEWIQLSDSDMNAVSGLLGAELQERDGETLFGEQIHERYADLGRMEILQLVDSKKKPDDVPL